MSRTSAVEGLTFLDITAGQQPGPTATGNLVEQKNVILIETTPVTRISTRRT